MENNEWNIQSESISKVKNTKKNIAIILSILGIAIVLSQVIPLSRSYIQGEFEMLKVRLMKDPIPKEYIGDEFAYYDPGKSYFENLSNNAEGMQYSGQFTYDPQTKKSKPIVVDDQYSKDMYMTIGEIGIENIKISSNVESSEEKVYDRYLKSGLAHFKGTPLPGDGGNSFIYGHSAVETFFSRHNNLPETIFTRLENIEIGNKVYIDRDGDRLEYIVRNKKIVSPEDFSILQTQNDKETVTLMTCWPLGVGTKRLVVVAERY
jgi:LPXTG-site transpeptidase (sortase) family protein